MLGCREAGESGGRDRVENRAGVAMARVVGERLAEALFDDKVAPQPGLRLRDPPGNPRYRCAPPQWHPRGDRRGVLLQRSPEQNGSRTRPTTSARRWPSHRPSRTSYLTGPSDRGAGLPGEPPAVRNHVLGLRLSGVAHRRRAPPAPGSYPRAAGPLRGGQAGTTALRGALRGWLAAGDPASESGGRGR